LVLVVILGVAGGYYYWHTIAGLFQRTSVNLSSAGGGAMNVLMVGSDSRQGLTDPEDVKRFGTVGGRRSDTIILAQIIPSQQRGVIISIPRDLWVTVHHGGSSYEGKINSAYAYGPQAVIDTVYGLTGVPINHYVEVNISGFRNIVDSIGGIDVCLDRELGELRAEPLAGLHPDGSERDALGAVVVARQPAQLVQPRDRAGGVGGAGERGGQLVADERHPAHLAARVGQAVGDARPGPLQLAAGDRELLHQVVQPQADADPGVHPGDHEQVGEHLAGEGARPVGVDLHRASVPVTA
jgi:LCP family protein required for cell wall assembly